jgi:hypothetical protein
MTLLICYIDVTVRHSGEETKGEYERRNTNCKKIAVHSLRGKISNLAIKNELQIFILGEKIADREIVGMNGLYE